MQFDTSSLWMYIHFPRLQLNLQCQQMANRETSSEPPVAIYDSHSNACIQLNQASLALGLKKGMGLASASLLSEDLVLFEYQQEQETSSLNSIANMLYLVTSDIALDPPQGIYLRVQNMLSLYGGINAYWRIIENSLATFSVEYQYATAYSVNVAKILAYHHGRMLTQDRSIIQQELYKCPLRLSDIDLQDIEKLSRIGVTDMGTLFNIPLADLASRLSKFSLQIIAELRGQAPAKVTFYTPSEYYQEKLELCYEVELIARLLPIINKLLDNLERFLLVRNAVSLACDLSLYQRDKAALDIRIESARPLYRSQDWYDIIALKLAQLSLQAPVYAIALDCHKLEHAQAHCQDFFSAKDTHIAALSLLSRLQAKLGKKSVRQAVFCADHRPEKASFTVPFENKNNYSQKSSSASGVAHKDRPGMLLPEPLFLSDKVKVIKGPERIVTAWWGEHKVQRDYFIAENQQGQQMWIFKDPDNKWYLHGYFI